MTTADRTSSGLPARAVSVSPTTEGSGSTPGVHVVVPTHTPRYLDLVLAAFGLQTRPPETVVVAADSDDPAIGRVMDEVWPRVVERLTRRGIAAPTLVHVSRPHQGEARLNQNRNNGLRALEQHAALNDADLVVLVDGDTLLAEDAGQRYAALAAQGVELVIPFRVDLRPDVSAEMCLDRLLGDDHKPLGHLATAREYERLEVRERRYLRQLRQRAGVERRMGLVKPHKPKVLGGHHAVSVGRLRQVNGFDERYTGWGFDDDELARRLHAIRPMVRCEIAVRTIMAFHLWHESRAPKRLSESPGHALFNVRPFPRRAEFGWDRPTEQTAPVTRIVAGSTNASVGAAAPAH